MKRIILWIVGKHKETIFMISLFIFFVLYNMGNNWNFDSFIKSFLASSVLIIMAVIAFLSGFAFAAFISNLWKKIVDKNK